MFWWVGAEHMVKGLKVRIATPDETDDELLALVTASLALIAQHAPARLEFARSSVRGLLIAPALLGFVANYSVRSRLVVLNPRFMRTPWADPCWTACTILHEFMHARLETRGLRWSQCDRVRTERLCYQASLVFAKRAGCDDWVVTWARQARERISESMTVSFRFERWLEDVKDAHERLGGSRLMARAIRRAEKRLAELRVKESTQGPGPDDASRPKRR